MRKPLEDMTPEELRAERAFQEQHFRRLVSHVEAPLPAPKTWYGRFWRKWCDTFNLIVRIVVGSVMYLVIISIVVAIARAILNAV